MPSAMIFDCEGERLSADEKAFFQDADPWGFIVFARHCQSAERLRAHCMELRECVGRDDAPIFIDQEGGRVARMKPPTFRAHVPAARFGELWRLDREKARQAARLNAFLLSRMVSDCGVNVNCVPMLDVPQPDADEIVLGDRTLARHADIIAALGGEIIAGTLAGGALPILKHIPGHGRALCDSHHDLPVVEAGKDDLRKVDFAPFRALNQVAMAMTAHVVYTAYDSENCASVSPAVIEDVIRGEIGFDGLLVSDDLKMKALRGTFSERVGAALGAGCDIALCCNFSMEEKNDAMGGAKMLTGAPASRAMRALSQQCAPDKADFAACYARLDEMLKPVLIA